MIRRCFSYCNRVFDLPHIVRLVEDGRPKPEISGDTLWLAMLVLFGLRAGSVNALQQLFRDGKRSQKWKRLLGDRPPSAEAMGYYAERVGGDSLRWVLHFLYTRLQRNRHILKHRIGGWLVLAVDGHELFSSYNRHCPACCQRSVTTQKGDRIQYYHRIVVASLVGGPLLLPLDVEEVRPGEDEIAAALRLLTRVQERYPKAYDVVTGDAAYADPRFVAFLRQHHKHLIAVLKDNHPDLLEDARSLCDRLPVTTRQEGRRTYRWWDSEGFTTWNSIEGSIRVVRSQETKRLQGDWVTSNWYWVTTCSCQEASTHVIWECGHRRWEIENQGFNTLCNHCRFDHAFHHQVGAILAFVLTACIAYVLTSAFYQLNLKPQARNHRCLSFLIRLFWITLDRLLDECATLPTARSP